MHSIILRHYMAWVGRKGKMQSVEGSFDFRLSLMLSMLHLYAA